MANIINQLEISGITYDIQDNDAQNTLLTKQDTLVSGVNIKTINNESLLGSGNIVIEGGTVDAYTKAETDALLAEKADTSAVTADIEAATSGKADTSAVTEAIDAATSGKADTSAVTSAIEAAVSGKADADDVYTKSQVSSATEVATALLEKQDVSGMSAYTTSDELTAYTYDKQTIDNKIGQGGTFDPTQYYTTANTSSSTEISTALAAKADATAVTADINAAVSGKANSADVYTTAQTSSSTEISTALLGKADVGDIPSLDGYFNGAEYDSGTTRINFKHDNTIVTYIDATDFIKDGMVDNVQISGGNLVITFNVDAGKETITIPLTDIFDPSNYYTTAQTESAITSAVSGKADTSAVTEAINAAVSGKADTSAVTEAIDAAVSGKANSSDVYTTAQTSSSTEISTALATKQDALEYYQESTDDMSATIEISNENEMEAKTADIFMDADGIEMVYTISDITEDTSNSQYIRVNADGAFLESTSDDGLGNITTTTLSVTPDGASINDDAIVTESVLSAATSGKADTSAVTAAIDAATSGKQDTLVSGTNIKTINNTSLLGSGNITIQGGGGANVVELTQAQYDALVTKDPDTFYIISDATPIDTSTFYTTAQTSSSTQIATALSGKQNTLTAGSGIDISNDVISVTGGGGGGGKAVSAGTNISITTGETADTINCTLQITATPSAYDTISVGTGSRGGSYNTLIGANARCDTNHGCNVFLVAQNSSNSSQGAYVNGTHNVIIGAIKDGYLNFDIQSFNTSRSVVIGGGGISTDKNNSVAIGYQANVSGTTKTNINNQLTIDTSNQVYIKDSTNTNDICIQDKFDTIEATIGDINTILSSL